MNRLARAALVSLSLLLVMGPTPGSVGACGGDDLDEPVDLRSYCEEREQLVCVRRFLRKEITELERDACRWDAVDSCARRSFLPGCRPTRRQAQTCLNALSSFDTLQTRESKLPECRASALCTEPSDEAAADGGGFGDP